MRERWIARGTKVKAKTPIKMPFQWSRKEMVMTVGVERKGRLVTYVRGQRRGLASDLDGRAEGKEARKTPEHVDQQLGGFL